MTGPLPGSKTNKNNYSREYRIGLTLTMISWWKRTCITGNLASNRNRNGNINTQTVGSIYYINIQTVGVHLFYRYSDSRGPCIT